MHFRIHRTKRYWKYCPGIQNILRILSTSTFFKNYSLEIRVSISKFNWIFKSGGGVDALLGYILSLNRTSFEPLDPSCLRKWYFQINFDFKIFWGILFCLIYFCDSWQVIKKMGGVAYAQWDTLQNFIRERAQILYMNYLLIKHTDNFCWVSRCDYGQGRI